MGNIAIIGRGSIAILVALELKKRSSDRNITIIGEKSRFSASYAAGAMINILSEIDCFNSQHPLCDWKLRNRTTALKAWNELDNYLKQENIIKRSLLEGTGTEIRLKNDSKNTVEKNSFNAILQSANLYDINISKDISQEESKIFIPEEKSVDTDFFFTSIETYLENNIECINSNIQSIKKLDNNKWILEDNKNVKRIFDQVIIACGAWSEKLINQSKGLERPLLKSFYGIGSALLIKSELPYIKKPTINHIIRTPNRGGTCGIHGVQRNNCIYIGASSHVTNIPLKYPKIPSIHNLIEGANSFLGLDTYELSFEIVTGYRPLTVDTVPIIGSLASGVFCIYGTKRDGFTWAPYLSKYLVNQLEGDNCTDWNELLEICHPNRNFVSSGEVNDCIKSYLINKKFENYQHGRTINSDQLNQYERIAKKAHEIVNKNKTYQIGLNPEVINMIYYSSTFQKMDSSQ